MLFHNHFKKKKISSETKHININIYIPELQQEKIIQLSCFAVFERII
jgi:hypothetical protein